jgi:hypothetical protein
MAIPVATNAADAGSDRRISPAKGQSMVNEAYPN